MFVTTCSPLGLLLAVLLAILPVTTVAQSCALALDIVPTLSTWNVTTRVESNTDTFVVGTPGATDIGVQGRIFVLTEGVCPTTVATALNVLEGAKFSGLDPTEMISIRMWPPSIQSTIEDVGRIDLRSIEWALSSEELADVAMEDKSAGEVMLQVCASCFRSVSAAFQFVYRHRTLTVCIHSPS